MTSSVVAGLGATPATGGGGGGGGEPADALESPEDALDEAEMTLSERRRGEGVQDFFTRAAFALMVRAAGDLRPFFALGERFPLAPRLILSSSDRVGSSSQA